MSKNRGCWWWFVTLFWVAVFLAILATWPPLILVTIVILGLAAAGLYANHILKGRK